MKREAEVTPANILWVFCEDLSPWFPCYGDRTVPTPHLDRLAREGVVFEQCFSPAPVCSPARSGVITGCWPATIGAHQHVSSRAGMPQIELPEPVRPVPAIFRDAGYFTYNYGKDDYNFAYQREDLYAGAFVVEGFYGARYADFRMSDLEAEWAYWKRGGSGPFFGQIGLWAGKNKPLAAAPVDPQTLTLPPTCPDTESFRNQVARHYNQIRTTDYQVGRILEALEREGQMERTWIFFFADHGYDIILQKQFCYHGGLHVPLIVVPPRGEAGRGVQRGTRRSDLVSTVDVAATNLACAGMEVPAWMEGRDVFESDYRRDFVVSGRDRCDGTVDWVRTVRTSRFRYVRNFMPDRALMQPQYRSGSPCFLDFMEWAQSGRMGPDLAYFAGPTRAPEELYDHEADPFEIHNLAADPGFAKVLVQHRHLLEQWMEGTGDRGGLPEPSTQYDWLLRQWGPEMCWGPEYADARARVETGAG